MFWANLLKLPQIGTQRALDRLFQVLCAMIRLFKQGALVELIKQLLRNQRMFLGLALLLNLVAGLLGIGTIAYINHYLLAQSALLERLLQFFGLIICFLAVSISAQMLLIRLGQNFVFMLQKMLVKQILDTEFATIQELGKARLLASLSNDIRSLSFGLLRLPELLQGVLFVCCGGAYLFFLSNILFWLVVGWLFGVFAVGHFIFKNVHHNFRKAREYDDKIQENYHSVLHGHRELTLNQFRAKHYYHSDFIANASSKKHFIVRADTFNTIASNWSNIMLLALVGVILYLASAYSVCDMPTATTAVLVVLFLRAPINAALGGLPVILVAQVSLKKILSLQLAPYVQDFQIDSKFDNWHTLTFKDVAFAYPKGFALQPVNLQIHRGEVVFCVGKNGSGKSTFSLLLAGLLSPTSGQIFVDNTALCAANLAAYRATISAIFGDFFLFTQALKDENWAEQDTIDYWLKRLNLAHKVDVVAGQLSTTALSQGQRKRLALFIALLEERKLLILDEWAADQDPMFRKFFYRELLPLFKERGITIFAISHDEAYFDVADRILLAKEGIVCEIPPSDKHLIAANIEKF